MKVPRTMIALCAMALSTAGPATAQGPEVVVGPPAGAPRSKGVADTTHASVGFGTVLPDEQIIAMLRRHDVLPYAVFFTLPGASGIHRVPADSARIRLITEMRTVRARESRSYPCGLISQLAMMRSANRNVRPAEGERDEPARRRLTEIRNATSAATRLMRGEPAIYGLKVTGSESNLRRLAADPLVREFHPPRPVPASPSGEPYVPGINVSEEDQRATRRILPVVERMTTVEVHAELDRHIAAPPPHCRGMMDNAVVDEPVVRLAASPEGGYQAAGLAFQAYNRVTMQEGVTRRTETSRVAHVTLVVKNPSRRAIDVGILGCTALLRLYSPDAPSGPPAWDERRGITCAQKPLRLTLAPGESREFTRRLDAWNALGGALPSGRYNVAVLFRLEKRTLEIPAGVAELLSGREGLEYAAESRLEGTRLRYSGTVRNASERPIHITYGACAIRLRAYRDSLRTGEPAWRSEFREPWGGQGMYGCPAYAKEHTLTPGEVFQPEEFFSGAEIIEILADSLPDARYWFAATLRLNHGHGPETPAGSAVLALPRVPLPSSRTALSITYRARAEVLTGSGNRAPVVRGIVTAAYTGPSPRPRPGMRSPPPRGGSLRRYSADCPVVLYLYGDRSRRDSAPRSGPPDWKSRDACGPELQQLILHAGDSARTLEVQVPVRNILASGIVAGRYYVAVAVQEENRRIVLSAGEVSLEP